MLFVEHPCMEVIVFKRLATLVLIFFFPSCTLLFICQDQRPVSLWHLLVLFLSFLSFQIAIFLAHFHSSPFTLYMLGIFFVNATFNKCKDLEILTKWNAWVVRINLRSISHPNNGNVVLIPCLKGHYMAEWHFRNTYKKKKTPDLKWHSMAKYRCCQNKNIYISFI